MSISRWIDYKVWATKFWLKFQWTETINIKLYRAYIFVIDLKARGACQKEEGRWEVGGGGAKDEEIE